MSDTSVKEMTNTKYNEKEYKYDATEQKNVCVSQKEESDMLSETIVTVKSIADVIDVKPLSTAANVTVIDMQDKLHANVNSNVLGELSQQGKQCRKSDHMVQQEYSPQNKRPTVWVQFSFGTGSGADGNFDYDPDSRNSFVLLVMMILLIMLLITAGWLTLVFNVKGLFDTFSSVPVGTVLGISIIMMVVWLGIGCSPCMRQAPCIYFVMLLVLGLMCLIAAVITCRYNTVIVIYAFMATAGVVFACIMLACTSFDFTSFWLYFIGISLVFGVVTMIICITMLVTGTYLKPLHIAILCISTILQSVGLIMELQMILGGKSIEMSEDDYALGALMLYTSIMHIFLNIVQLLGALDS